MSRCCVGVNSGLAATQYGCSSKDERSLNSNCKDVDNAPLDRVANFLKQPLKVKGILSALTDGL